MATEAASLLGLKPQALLAQAALESGWGKHVMQFANGDPANNLFGIKADSRWGGDKVTVSTLEYEQGVAVRKKAHFRAYEDYRQSFLDYVDFLKADPRYAKALQSTDDPVAYFQELQKAGYATDPNYAKKISAVLHGNEMSAATERLKAVENQPL
jgi:flagellar protein FlgJ